MAFWSGEKLSAELPRLIKKFKPDNLDCASYRLSVGEQVFTTTDSFATSGPTEPLISILKDPPNHTLRIRPGQFAFVMTEEVVCVPSDALALISMRAGYKFKGLINVSGFHVDPGWYGKLLFSVYNAGPAEVILERGEPAFLIVYADLDRISNKKYRGGALGQENIRSDLLQNMTAQVFSPLMLQRRIEQLSKEVSDVQNTTNFWRAGAISTATILSFAVATAAVFAAFSPSTLGVLFARLLDHGGYEIKFKNNTPPPEINTVFPGSYPATLPPPYETAGKN